VKFPRATRQEFPLIPAIDAARRAGARTLHELAAALIARGVLTPAGRGTWRPEQIQRALAAAVVSGTATP